MVMDEWRVIVVDADLMDLDAGMDVAYELSSMKVRSIIGGTFARSGSI